MNYWYTSSHPTAHSRLQREVGSLPARASSGGREGGPRLPLPGALAAFCFLGAFEVHQPRVAGVAGAGVQRTMNGEVKVKELAAQLYLTLRPHGL